MTTLVLDAGALIALERDVRDVWALLRVADEDGAVHVPAGAIGRTWQDGTRQALLSRALSRCDEVPLDGRLARAAGILCGKTRTTDVIDASVAITAAAAGRGGAVAVLTSDREDIGPLCAALQAAVDIIEVRRSPPDRRCVRGSSAIGLAAAASRRGFGAPVEHAAGSNQIVVPVR